MWWVSRQIVVEKLVALAFFVNKGGEVALDIVFVFKAVAFGVGALDDLCEAVVTKLGGAPLGVGVHDELVVVVVAVGGDPAVGVGDFGEATGGVVFGLADGLEACPLLSRSVLFAGWS